MLHCYGRTSPSAAPRTFSGWKEDDSAGSRPIPGLPAPMPTGLEQRHTFTPAAFACALPAGTRWTTKDRHKLADPLLQRCDTPPLRRLRTTCGFTRILPWLGDAARHPWFAMPASTFTPPRFYRSIFAQQRFAAFPAFCGTASYFYCFTLSWWHCRLNTYTLHYTPLPDARTCMTAATPWQVRCLTGWTCSRLLGRQTSTLYGGPFQHLPPLFPSSRYELNHSLP